MKQKVKVIDKVSGKTIEGQTELRRLDHFEIQKRNRMNIFRDKTKYTRKRKHKAQTED